jgi:Aminoglycoside/hydroxyurea antibiotic resistance kinase
MEGSNLIFHRLAIVIPLILGSGLPFRSSPIAVPGEGLRADPQAPAERPGQPGPCPLGRPGHRARRRTGRRCRCQPGPRGFALRQHPGRNRQPWLAIDPKAIAGDPELSVPELMWTRLHEAETAGDIRALLAAITHAAALDPAKARAWTIVRAVDYWLWGLDHGFTEDPVRCHRLLDALAR